MLVRFQPDQLAEIDTWAAKQEDKPSRPEAVRRLVKRGAGGLIAIALGPCYPVEREFLQLSTWDGVTYAAKGKSKQGMLWKLEGEHLVRQGIVNPMKEQRGHLLVGSKEDPARVLRDALARWDYGHEPKVEPLNLPQGFYFPRMARPHHQHPGDMPSGIQGGGGFAHERAAAAIQAISLTSRLLKAFQYVDPDQRNMQVFGGEFREILILAATEFEAQAKGVLRANHYQSPRGERLNTCDFVKVEPALRLKDYALAFHGFPWIDPVWPFAGWEREQATASLAWYDAYNAVKHDREQNSHRATLENAISATVAVIVICVAEFGYQFLQMHDPLGEVFSLRHYPSWSPGDTQGSEVTNGEGLKPTDYPFA